MVSNPSKKLTGCFSNYFLVTAVSTTLPTMKPLTVETIATEYIPGSILPNHVRMKLIMIAKKQSQTYDHPYS